MLSSLTKKISLRSLVSTFSLSLFILIETFLIKAYLLNDAGVLTSPIGVLRVSGQEILMVLIASLFIVLLSSFLRKISYRWFTGFYAVGAFIYSLSLIAQAVLFRTTGFGLNREYVQNYLRNPAEVNRMILAEVPWPSWLGLLFLLALLVWLSRIPESRRITHLWAKLKGKAALSARKLGLVLALTFIIVLEVGSLLTPLESVNPAIRQVAFYELMRCFGPEKTEAEEGAIDIKPQERLDKPIIIEPSESFRPMNVVLIIFESLSWKYCDIYKTGFGATPFLAELGKNALVVERLYTVDPHTTKALISIIAGIYPYPEPSVMEARPGVLPEKALPHLLRKIGYRTAFFQTANNYEERPSVVSNLGYELFRGLYHLPQENFAYVNYFGKEEMMMLQPSLEWVEKNQSQPFFLTYLTLSTHHEYGFPPDFHVNDFNVDNEKLNRYLNAVRYTDYFIKRVFEEYDKRGWLENTIFIIVGDHGESFGEHGLTGHNYSLWEEGIRVPGIIYAPALMPKAGKIEGFRSVLDIAPTVCDLLGLKVTEGEFLGRSLMAPADDNREFFYTGWLNSRIMAVRRGRMKYVFPNWSPLAEVYDNLADSEDSHNLFRPGTEAAREAEQLKNKAKRWSEVLIAQYRQWSKDSLSKYTISQPENFIKKMDARFENLMSIYGYGFFPEKTEPGRTVWVRVGIKCENKIKKSLRISLIMKHDQADLSYTQRLWPRVPLEKLNSGEYSSAESIIVVPAEWPEGRPKLYLSVMDEVRSSFISPVVDGSAKEGNGLIYIGELELFPAGEKTK